MTLPYDPNGYAVDEQTGEVHRRWAEHARGLRRTTSHGLYAVLGDLAPKACPECWPPIRLPRRMTRTGASEPMGVEVTEHATGQGSVRSVEDAEALIRGDLVVTSDSIDLADTEDGS